METQEILNTEIGEKEVILLKPAKVKIVKVEVEQVGEKKNNKLTCSVKHPDKEETMKVSSVKYENKGKLDVVGLWVNLDEDKKIRKSSSLAVLMSFLGVAILRELEGKEIETTTDEKGYLVFKAY